VDLEEMVNDVPVPTTGGGGAATWIATPPKLKCGTPLLLSTVPPPVNQHQVPAGKADKAKTIKRGLVRIRIWFSYVLLWLFFVVQSPTSRFAHGRGWPAVSNRDFVPMIH